MSLRDASKKMSKSDPVDRSRLGLLDSDDEIVEKLKLAKTDSIYGVTYDPTQRPEVANLLDIFSGFTERPPEEIAREYERADMAQFKKALTDVVISHLRPIREQILKYEHEQWNVDSLPSLGYNRIRVTLKMFLHEGLNKPSLSRLRPWQRFENSWGSCSRQDRETERPNNIVSMICSRCISRMRRVGNQWCW